MTPPVYFRPLTKQRRTNLCSVRLSVSKSFLNLLRCKLARGCHHHFQQPLPPICFHLPTRPHQPNLCRVRWSASESGQQRDTNQRASRLSATDKCAVS